MSEFSKVENLPVTAVEVLPSVMTEAEARQCVEEINSNINRIRLLLVELESREGYVALGFANMSQLMQSDLFAKARSTLQKELQAGRIERHHLNVPIGTFSESHLRPFTKLKPDYYKQAVDKAFSIAGIRPVAAKDMSQAVAELMRSNPDAAKRGIVERLKEKPLFKASDFCATGDVFTLTKLEGSERKYNGCWAIALDVKDFNVVVDVHDTTLIVKPENLKPIDEPDVRRQLPQILKRIRRLRDCGLLDRCAYTVLESLGRQTYLTPVEEGLLQWLENHYGVVSEKN
jgi:hypothetical protein